MAHTSGMEGTTAQGTPTLADVRLEGARLADAAASIDLPLRMMGGVAFYLRCPSAKLPQLARSYGDVDFVAWSSARREVTDFFEAQGYEQDKMFNALHGAQRLNFHDPVRGRPIDVVLDEFSMCHRIDFRERLLLEPVTVPLTDLLLTKLQVVEQNDKDVRDILALLLDHELGEEPGDAVAPERLGELLGDDWGFEHTVRRNLERVGERVDDYDLGDGRVAVVRARIDGIVDVLDRAPKTLRWRMRSRIGERLGWYAVPEEGRR